MKKRINKPGINKSGLHKSGIHKFGIHKFGILKFGIRQLRILIAIMLTAILTTSCGILTGGGNDPPDELTENLIVVGFSQVGAESDWRAANTVSIQTALREERGFKLIYDDAQQKIEKQITAIRNFIQQEVDYIVLAPTTETGWDTVLQEAKAAGIPVILVDRMIEVADNDLFTCWIGSDFRLEGNTAVKWMEERFEEETINIVHLQGNIGSSAQIGRTEGLDAGLLANPNWNLVARESGEFTQAKGQEVMESFIAQGLQFDVVYCENDNMTYGVIDTLREAGLTPGEDVTIISFDANRTALEMTLAGEISYNVECNPLQGPHVKKIIEQLEAGIVPPKFTYIEETAFDSESITREEVEERTY